MSNEPRDWLMSCYLEMFREELASASDQGAVGERTLGCGRESRSGGPLWDFLGHASFLLNVYFIHLDQFQCVELVLNS